MPKIVDTKARREAILTATWRTIARHGVARATVRRIAAEAGVSTGFISHYFRDKKEVLAAALRLSNERSQTRISARAEGLTGLAAQLNESFRTTLLDMVTHRPAQALGFGGEYGLRQGARADLVVMASESPGTVVVERPDRLLVFHSGQIVSAGAGAAVLGIDGPEL